MLYFLKTTKSFSLNHCLMLPIIALSLTTSACASTSSTTIGRYLTVENQALPAQKDLLQQTLQVKFPATVKTIGDAMHYLLRFSGYSLVDYKSLPHEAQNMMRLPLPEIDRRLGPVTLQESLQILAGKPFALVIDPVHRLISFRLKTKFQSLYKPSFHYQPTKIIF